MIIDTAACDFKPSLLCVVRTITPYSNACNIHDSIVTIPGI